MANATTLLRSCFNKLKAAKCPEDIFADRPADHTIDFIANAFRQWSTWVHPDKHPKQVALAEEAFKLLLDIRDQALEKLKAGTYGDRKPVEPIIIRTKTNAYTVTDRLPEGALCSLYKATDKDGKIVVVKVVKNLRDTDLMVAEAQNLMTIHTKTDHPSPKLRKHVIDCITSFDITEGKVRRRANVLSWPGDGFVTLAEILAAYPNGLDLRDAAWMFNRVLAALVCAHDAGIVHGAIFPEHILLNPDTHNGILIDWCYSVKNGSVMKAIDGSHKSLYPNTVLNKKPATPATDVYMAAMLLDRMCGFPGISFPRAFNNLIGACLLPSAHRIQTAHELAEAFRELLEKLYGKPKFRKFVWPPKS